MTTAMANPQELLAVQNDLLIKEHLRAVGINFLVIGKLLNESRNNLYWQVLGYDRMQDYVENPELSLPSWSWACRLMDIWQFIVMPKLEGVDYERLLEALSEVGVSKLTRMLPAARDGRLTEDDWEAAKILSDRDLQRHFRNKPEPATKSRQDESGVYCPRCGTFLGESWLVSHGYKKVT